MRFYDTVPCEPKSKASDPRSGEVCCHKKVYTWPIIACLHRTLLAKSVLLYYRRRDMTQQVGVKAWKRWQVLVLKSCTIPPLDSRWFSWYVAIFFYKLVNMNISLHSFMSFRSPGTESRVLQSVHICSGWGEGVLFKRVCLQKSQTFPDSQKMRENISWGWWQLLQTSHRQQSYLYWTFRIWYEMKTTQIRKQILSFR